jgi:hypothetical protein
MPPRKESGQKPIKALAKRHRHGGRERERERERSTQERERVETGPSSLISWIT